MKHRRSAAGFGRLCAFACVCISALISLNSISVEASSQTPSASTPAKTLNVGLRASWHQTPLLYEAAEHMATIDDAHYWQFIDSLIADQKQQSNATTTDATTPVTDEVQYALLTRLSRAMLGAASHQQFMFSVWNRVHSARLAAFQQLLHEELTAARKLDLITQDDKQCATIVQFQGVLTCAVSEILELTLDSEYESNATLHSFDHEINFATVATSTSDSNAQALILYADLLSNEWHKAHAQLKQYSETHKLKYILRPFYRSATFGSYGTSLQLPGWGIELAIKNMEYKVLDDSKIQLSDEALVQLPGETQQDDNADELVIDNLDHTAVLDLKDLGVQACQRIIAASHSNNKSSNGDSFQLLRELAQNFPMYAQALTRLRVNHTVESALQRAGQMDIPPAGVNLLQINGLSLDVDDLHLIDLWKLLQSEMKIADALRDTELQSALLSALMQVKDDYWEPQLTQQQLMMGMQQPSSTKGFLIDMSINSPETHRTVTFLNDLTRDNRYKVWPQSLREFLTPAWPNQLRYVAKNLYTGVVYADCSTQHGLMMAEQARFFVQANAPIRLGLLCYIKVDSESEANEKQLVDSATRDDAQHRLRRVTSAVNSVSGQVAALFHHLNTTQSRQSAFDFLLSLQNARVSPVTEQHVLSSFQKHRKDKSQDVRTILTSLETQQFLHRCLDYVEARNLPKPQPFPHLFIQGQRYTAHNSQTQFRELMMQGVMTEQHRTQLAVAFSQLNDESDLDAHWASKPNVYARAQPLILQSVSDCQFLESMPRLDALRRIVYAQQSNVQTVVASMTLWLVADLNSLQSLRLIQSLIAYVEQDERARFALVLSSNTNGLLNRVVSVLQQNVDSSQFLPLIKSILSVVASVGADANDETKLSTALLDEPNLASVQQHIQSAIDQSNALDSTASPFPSSITQLPLHTLIANGRVLHLDASILRGSSRHQLADWRLLRQFSDRNFFAQRIVDLVAAAASAAPEASTSSSDAALLALTALSRRQSTMSTEKHIASWPGSLNDQSSIDSIATLQHNSPNAVLTINVLLDPLSHVAQRLVPLLLALRQSFDCTLRIHLHPKTQFTELPLKRFYRYNALSVPSNQQLLASQFDAAGALVPSHASVQFVRLQTPHILTSNLHVGESWSVSLLHSTYDCDNLHLPSVGNAQTQILYQLQSLLLNMQLMDAETHEIPAGLQLYLESHAQPYITDTLVMANLGYAQLATQLGAYRLRLNKVHAQLYELQDSDGEWRGAEARVCIHNLHHPYSSIAVRKRRGMQHVQLSDLMALTEDQTASQSELVKLIAQSVDPTRDPTLEKLHIFSLASGHLYERFLKLMILSVLKHTRHPVKFFFVSNFASPQFMEFIPKMARHYGFEAQFVTYSWPVWLRRQTEKQRIIWGMKILFLDVLFPLTVKRIVYIDADQIVRGDVAELFTLDLQGAPYAYTPFCDSNHDTEGFRFWKQGYWAEHLRGRPYHISALYVVDLQRFRAIRAGDTLRAVYDNLSQDPNSLSNLDQDLPNFASHQVPIYSLPLEWLWCQTWCSMDTLSTAKTIDLCNNPLTKTPKLEVAKQLIPEWIDLDNEAKQLETIFAQQQQQTQASVQVKDVSSKDKPLPQSAQHSEL